MMEIITTIIKTELTFLGLATKRATAIRQDSSDKPLESQPFLDSSLAAFIMDT
jgi:hypothetical protein